MINEHINALNRAYAIIDTKIEGMTSPEEMRAFLDDIEAQSIEPYMDLIYNHATETIKQKLREL
jgi:pullulanase/glycogen debranching enzyme